MGKVIIVSAPSGSGKSTLIASLISRSDFNLKFSVSATTRSPRGEEQNGKDYYFLSVQEFEKKISENQFVEYEQVYAGRYYGTLKSEIERIFSLGGNVIFDVDVIGGINLKKIFAESALSIFIQPPSIEELRRRLIGRATDSMEEIEKRISKAGQEMQSAEKFDKIIVNDDLETAKKEICDSVANFITFHF
ncbi:MAG: guanylate kinase [Bacteroidales bacterium]|nr:guanylate kinase [Bacteroidales bacterium]